MHSKSDNMEIMINYETDEVIKELFDTIKIGYQNNLELIKGSEFVFHYIHYAGTVALNHDKIRKNP